MQMGLERTLDISPMRFLSVRSHYPLSLLFLFTSPSHLGVDSASFDLSKLGT